MHVVNGEVNESFKILGIQQGYVISSRLFNLFIDGVVREVKARVGNGVELCTYNAKLKLATILFADDTVDCRKLM